MCPPVFAGLLVLVERTRLIPVYFAWVHTGVPRCHHLETLGMTVEATSMFAEEPV